MVASKQQLQQRLDKAESKYNRLVAKTYPTDRVSEFFHLGTVGGSGSPVQKLNRQREKDLDRRIDDAKEMIRLHGVIADLKWRIRNLDQVVQKAPKPHREVKPRPVKSAPSATYLNWANTILDDMEDRIETARSKMHGIQWDDPHDHHLRGEIAAYIEVQAHLIGQHFRGNQSNTKQILEGLQNLKVKKDNDYMKNPTSRYLPEFCKGVATGIEKIVSTWR